MGQFKKAEKSEKENLGVCTDLLVAMEEDEKM